MQLHNLYNALLFQMSRNKCQILCRIHTLMRKAESKSNARIAQTHTFHENEDTYTEIVGTKTIHEHRTSFILRCKNNLQNNKLEENLSNKNQIKLW